VQIDPLHRETLGRLLGHRGPGDAGDVHLAIAAHVAHHHQAGPADPGRLADRGRPLEPEPLPIPDLDRNDSIDLRERRNRLGDQRDALAVGGAEDAIRIIDRPLHPHHRPRRPKAGSAGWQRQGQQGFGKLRELRSDVESGPDRVEA
jgi:hypothetical protein